MGHWFRPVSQSPVCRRRQSEDFSKTPHLAGSSCCRTKTWCNFVQELQLFDCERDLPALVIANVSRQKGQRLIPATPFYTCCLKLWPCSRRNPELRCLAGDQRKSTVTVFQTGLGLNPPPLAPQCRPPSVQSCVVCKGHGCLELRFKCQQLGKDSHSLFGLYLYPVCRET